MIKTEKRICLTSGIFGIEFTGKVNSDLDGNLQFSTSIKYQGRYHLIGFNRLISFAFAYELHTFVLPRTLQSLGSALVG